MSLAWSLAFKGASRGPCVCSVSSSCLCSRRFARSLRGRLIRSPSSRFSLSFLPSSLSPVRARVLIELHLKACLSSSFGGWRCLFGAFPLSGLRKCPRRRLRNTTAPNSHRQDRAAPSRSKSPGFRPWPVGPLARMQVGGMMTSAAPRPSALGGSVGASRGGASRRAPAARGPFGPGAFGAGDTLEPYTGCGKVPRFIHSTGVVSFSVGDKWHFLHKVINRLSTRSIVTQSCVCSFGFMHLCCTCHDLSGVIHILGRCLLLRRVIYFDGSLGKYQIA